MQELSKEVFDYIKDNNAMNNTLYNGILLEVLYSFEENELKVMSLEDLIRIADNVCNNDYLEEVLQECIYVAKESD